MMQAEAMPLRLLLLLLLLLAHDSQPKTNKCFQIYCFSFKNYFCLFRFSQSNHTEIHTIHPGHPSRIFAGQDISFYIANCQQQ